MSTSVRQPLDDDLTVRHRDILAAVTHLGGEAVMKDVQAEISEVYGLPGRELVSHSGIYRSLEILVERGYLEVVATDPKAYALTDQAVDQLWSLGQYFNLFGELNPGEIDE